MYKFSIQVEKLFFQFLCHFSYVGLAPWGVAVPAEGDIENSVYDVINLDERKIDMDTV